MGIKDITLCSFSTLYSSLLYQRKASAKPWIAKWEQDGVIDSSDWTFIWNNVHHYSVSQVVQSTLWELLHMNFTLLNWLSEVMVFVNFVGLKRWKELIFS